MTYLIVEPTVVTAVTDDVVVTLNVTDGITITDGAPVTMAPDIGIASDRSVGTSSWNVKTNSDSGYTLAVKASASPALVNGVIDSFNDYTEATPGTPDAWGGVASGQKEFGFSGRGTHVLNTFYTTSPADCGNTGTGVPNANSKYLGFETSDQTLASSNTYTTTAGVTSYICFAAQQNAVYAASGTYTATITGTALVQ